MIRLVTYILLSLAVTAAAAWLIGLDGSVLIEIAGYRLQPRLGIAALAIVILILLCMIVWGVARYLIRTPKVVARHRQERRYRAGVEALSEGFIALQAGDANRARALARDAQTKLDGNPAAQLLEARAELAHGDYKQAREHYRALIAEPRTALAALSGLYDQARAQGRTDAALTFARKAAAIAPNLDWANDAVFDDLAARGAWDEALQQVSNQSATTKEEKAAKKRRMAVLNTALAASAEATDPADALAYALAALKLEPDFVPAALIAARVHVDRGDTRKASSLLRRLWRDTGHPDIATLYAHVQPGASAVDRLKRTRELVGSPPATREGAIVLARAAIDAYEWALARNALANYASQDPSQAVCSLMAEIEEGQAGDQGKAREWLSRAVRAPRDPAWTADGVVADEWEPVSPVTGKLDAFEWKVPVSAVATRNGTVRQTPETSGDTEDPATLTPAATALPPATEAEKN